MRRVTRPNLTAGRHGKVGTGSRRAAGDDDGGVGWRRAPDDVLHADRESKPGRAILTGWGHGARKDEEKWDRVRKAMQVGRMCVRWAGRLVKVGWVWMSRLRWGSLGVQVGRGMDYGMRTKQASCWQDGCSRPQNMLRKGRGQKAQNCKWCPRKKFIMGLYWIADGLLALLTLGCFHGQRVVTTRNGSGE